MLCVSSSILCVPVFLFKCVCVCVYASACVFLYVCSPACGACVCVCVPLSRCEGSVNTLPNSHTSPSSSSSSSLFFPRTSHQFPSIYLLLLSVSGARIKYEGRIFRQKNLLFARTLPLLLTHILVLIQF